MEPDNLLPFAGVAEIVGLSRSGVRRWFMAGKMPNPDGYVGAGHWPVWREATIRSWMSDPDLAEALITARKMGSAIGRSRAHRIQMGIPEILRERA